MQSTSVPKGQRGLLFISMFALLLLKMVLFRSFIYDNVKLEGMRSDVVAVLAVVCLFEIVTSARWKALVFGIVNFAISLMLFASTVYFNYYSTVPIYTALNGAGQVGQVGDSVRASIEGTNYLLFIDLPILLLFFLYKRYKNGKFPASAQIAKRWQVAIVLTVSVVLSGFYIKTDKDIANELVLSENLGFLNYQITAAIKVNEGAGAVDKETIVSNVEQLQQEQAGLDKPKEDPTTLPTSMFGVAKGKNVIVVQLEAFQNFAVQLKVNGQEVTPVLNGLASSDFYFPHFFQQIGQGNTADAEFMSNTSIYPTGVEAMSAGYGDRVIPSTPRLLGKQGYVSNTFHVNDVTFWNRNQMYPALGFTKYYDKPSFTNDNFNGFGASDVELYRVGIEKLKALKDANQPFYAQFVTASSHHPFKIPKNLRKLDLPKSIEGTQLGDYLTALNYTDYAIGQLIQSLKDNGMWDNTVLVLYGDHFGLQPKDNDPDWVSEELGIKYEERVSRFNVPFFVHVPGQQGSVREVVGGQVDIMPTIANLLGVSLKDEGYTVFGNDLFNVEHNTIGMRYYMPTGSFINDDILFLPGKGFEDGKATDLKTLQPVADFSKYRKDYDYVLGLEKLSDQYVRSLPRATN
ncbi:LTA synthase family protein [Cohnella suwonensis]|uniref:LTA synthase family protein n=1 Tax=Cohnella suwonensis TaxID=696072 RepID=A0ABW0M3Q1_9BACL